MALNYRVKMRYRNFKSRSHSGKYEYYCTRRLSIFRYILYATVYVFHDNGGGVIEASARHCSTITSDASFDAAIAVVIDE